MTLHAIPAITEVLDYELLVNDYKAGLVDRLRGFGAAAECLSLWVPDEDAATSLRNLWDAAAAVGEREITLWLGPTTTATLDADEVLTTAARFGVATLTHGRTGWLVEVAELRPAAPIAERRAAPSRPTLVRNEPIDDTPVVARPSGDIHPSYVAAIASAAADLRHTGAIEAGPGHIVVSATVLGTTLTLAIDPSTHMVVCARFADAPVPGVMERFCGLVEGVPILDATDHGAQRLELALRDHRSHRPVAGIVTPRAADPCFHLPIALVRAALLEYREQTGFDQWVSSHDPGPGARWRTMSAGAREAAVRAVLREFIAASGGGPGTIELVAIEIDVRILLRIDGALLGHHGPRIVLDLEHALRDAVDPRLEVVLEEIRDRNRKRRLALVE